MIVLASHQTLCGCGRRTFWRNATEHSDSVGVTEHPSNKVTVPRHDAGRQRAVVWWQAAPALAPSCLLGSLPEPCNWFGACSSRESGANPFDI
jgi:hypothetical protein